MQQLMHLHHGIFIRLPLPPTIITAAVIYCIQFSATIMSAKTILWFPIQAVANIVQMWTWKKEVKESWLSNPSAPHLLQVLKSFPDPVISSLPEANSDVSQCEPVS
jgi:hypothetical protein